MGEDGEMGAGAGDLYCFVSVTPHKSFERYDDHVAFAMPLSFPQAALGDTIQVPTLERDENGAVKNRRSRGFPQARSRASSFASRTKVFPNRGGYRGDQICVVQLVVPKKLDERQKELLREYAEIGGEDPDEHPRGFFDKLKDAFKGRLKTLS